MSPSDYRHAWRQAVTDYRAIQKDPSLAASSASAGGADDRQAVSQSAFLISQQIRDIGRRVNELKAPPQYQYLQEDTYLFYLGQADAYLGYSSAITSGDDAKVSLAQDAINNYATQQQQKVEGDLTKLGRDGDQFKDVWKDVFKDPAAAPDTSTPTAPKQPEKPKKPAHKRKRK
jgi:hypothetical protein